MPCIALHCRLRASVWPTLAAALLSLLPHSLQLINCVFFIIPNAYVLGHLCSWFHPLVLWSGFVRWTIWNTIFLIFLVQAHSANPANTPRWRERRSTVFLLDIGLNGMAVRPRAAPSPPKPIAAAAVLQASTSAGRMAR